MKIKAVIRSTSGYILVHKTRVTPARKLETSLLYKTPHNFSYQTDWDESLEIRDRLLGLREGDR